MRDYLPYGEHRIDESYQTAEEVLANAKAYRNRYSFGNKERDDESGLRYFEARYYESRMGRFTSQDPVFWELGRTDRANELLVDPQQFNSYSFGRDNPIRFTDPTGEIAETWWDAANFAWDAAAMLTKASEYTGSWAAKKVWEATNSQSLMASWERWMSEAEGELKNKAIDTAADTAALMIPGYNATIAKATAWAAVKTAVKSGVKEARGIMRRSMEESYNSWRLAKIWDFQNVGKNGKEVLSTLEINIKDPKYKWWDWVKRSYYQETESGWKVEMHFMQNKKTWETNGMHLVNEDKFNK